MVERPSFEIHFRKIQSILYVNNNLETKMRSTKPTNTFADNLESVSSVGISPGVALSVSNRRRFEARL